MIARGASGRHSVVGRLGLVACAGLGALAGATSTARLARADGDDRAAAEALVVPMQKAAPEPATIEAIARARDALEQSTRLRAAGDEAHAKAADGLAREWAETARDLARAAAAEKLADERRRQAIQALAQLERTRALVEDGIARLGRLRAELESAVARKAVEVHDGDPKPMAGTKGGASANLRGAPASGSPGGSTP
jgi:hypothetical protein